MMIGTIEMSKASCDRVVDMHGARQESLEVLFGK